jgi:hypothetical protein
VTLFSIFSRKTAAVTLLALLAGSQSPRTAKAQLTAPAITNLQTAYGAKNGVPAATANMSYTINGSNFSSILANNTVRVERKVIYNGQTTWSPVSSTYPTNASATQLTAVIGNVAAGDYRVSLWVRDKGYSNYKDLVVVSNVVGLQSATPSAAKGGATIMLKGNLMPRIDARVVMTPPAQYAAYIPAREITPTTVGAFETTFKLPIDVWDGVWLVRIVGWDGGTNNIPFTVLPSVAPSYQVTVINYKCLVETADGPGDDEPYVSTITLATDTTEWLGLGWEGSYVSAGIHSGSTAGTVYDLEYWYPNGDRGQARRKLTDPTKARFIIGLAECDQWYLTGGFTQVWDHDQSRYDYAEWLTKKAVDATLSAYWAGNATLNSGDPTQVSNWIKDKLYHVLNDGDDECIGAQVVSFSQAEVYKARALNGSSYTKKLTMTGDGSKYEVTIGLRKSSGF